MKHFHFEKKLKKHSDMGATSIIYRENLFSQGEGELPLSIPCRWISFTAKNYIIF